MEKEEKLPNFFTILEEYTLKNHYINICPCYLEKYFFKKKELTELKELKKLKDGLYTLNTKNCGIDFNFLDLKIYEFLEKYPQYKVNTLSMVSTAHWYKYKYIFQKK